MYNCDELITLIKTKKLSHKKYYYDKLYSILWLIIRNIWNFYKVSRLIIIKWSVKIEPNIEIRMYKIV